jgi:DNA replication licensing factor MCM6
MLNFEESRFVDWQRVRVQENADEIPAGSLPRSLDVILRNELVEQAKAGDKCVFTGMLVVLGQAGGQGRGDAVLSSGRGGGEGGAGGEGVGGLKKLGCKEMSFKTVFVACGVQPATKQADGAFRVGVTEGREGGREGGIGGDEEGGPLPDGGLTEGEVEEVKEMRKTPDLYKHLAESIAPNIFGHMDIKRG